MCRVSSPIGALHKNAVAVQSFLIFLPSACLIVGTGNANFTGNLGFSSQLVLAALLTNMGS